MQKRSAFRDRSPSVSGASTGSPSARVCGASSAAAWLFVSGETPIPVEVVGWGPDVTVALDRAEALAHLALFAGVLGLALVLLTLSWIAATGIRR